MCDDSEQGEMGFGLLCDYAKAPCTQVLFSSVGSSCIVRLRRLFSIAITQLGLSPGFQDP